MSEAGNRMIQDINLAGLVERTGRDYLRPARQSAADCPDLRQRLRQVT